MVWQMRMEAAAERREEEAAVAPDGRFVLHRHRDAEGVHLDLRLECEGCLMGWRIAGGDLEGAPWATEKMPHGLRWLVEDGDAERLDEGTYRWAEQAADRRAVDLLGTKGARRVVAERIEAMPLAAQRAVCEALFDAMPLAAQRAVCEALFDAKAGPEDAARLLRDGLHARRTAVARLCGLGRELDGDAFAEEVVRRSLEGLTLEEVHAQLRTYELRFDRKYPPQPVSRPEKLPDEERARNAIAMEIARGTD